MRTDTLTPRPELDNRARGASGPIASTPSRPTAGRRRTHAPRVIVAFNGSPAATDALRLGIRLARSSRSDLVVACVFPPESLAGITFDARATRVADGDHRIFVRQDAEAVLAEARGTMPDDLAVTFRAVEAESIANGLRQLAVEEDATTLVLGSAHRGLADRLLHHAIARNLLRHPPCGVVVAEHADREANPESQRHT
jgi:nucleotide-binding universal stress UspA family protein